MTRKRWMTAVGARKERRQNGISNRTASILIPYSDAHSINIQLHQDRRRAIHPTPLFAFPSREHPLTHIPAYVQRVGERERERASRGKSASPVYWHRHCTQSRQGYNNVYLRARVRFKSTRVSIDL